MAKVKKTGMGKFQNDKASVNFHTHRAKYQRTGAAHLTTIVIEKYSPIRPLILPLSVIWYESRKSLGAISIKKM
ncbi:MAG: hypothetical protein LCH83_06315 [Proteobacteria bacterium]|nr:hypothetical protein [Pseudomonadota bacterium]